MNSHDQRTLFSTLERKVLRQRQIIAAAGTALWFTSIIGFLFALSRPLFYQESTPNGVYVIVAGLCLSWVWFLRHQISYLMLLNKDRQSIVLEVISGRATLIPTHGFGLFSVQKYDISINQRVSRASHLRDITRYAGAAVTAHVATNSSMVLSIYVNADDSAENSQKTVPQSVVIADDREVHILQLMSRGLSDKEIAKELKLSPTTIRTYNSALFKRWSVPNRKQAVAYAKEKGVIVVD